MAPKFNRPNITVVGIEMRGGNLLQQNFLVKFQVQNPNDRALPVSGLHAELNVGGERDRERRQQPSLRGAPHGSESEFDMTITANMALALLQLADAISTPIPSTMRSPAPPDLICLSCDDLPFHQTGSFLARFTNSLKLLIF